MSWQGERVRAVRRGGAQAAAEAEARVRLGGGRAKAKAQPKGSEEQE